MKTLITFLILSLFWGNHYKYQTLTNYIEIRHTGMQEYPIKTLIVSNKEIDKNNFTKLLTNNKNLNSDQKNAMLNMLYIFLITDSNSYQSIIDFCSNNRNFFTNDINKNHVDYQDYAIKIEGKNYDIYYKLKDQFFNNLADYIKAKNGDKSLIKELNSY